mmetsp:Transcript_28879/g.37950  ORF Transcript_28879/g.37950 Transcript_28879/m.37950 type:complete len:518 (+) Transcript_28879:10-1563(+)
MKGERIVIVGSGPCGLGAAWRLRELNVENFIVLEKFSFSGGLACTEIDDQGFLWDMGGHVIFSHYQYFDRLLDHVTKDWCKHHRVASIWMRGKFIPYPLQNNIHHLPKEELQICLDGLLEVERKRDSLGPPQHFGQWLERSFGPGLMEVFLTPYNRKVWGVEPREMNVEWMGERVAMVDLATVMKTIVSGEDQSSWGPNHFFRFPLHGGTGSVWSALCGHIGQEKFRFNTKVVSINTDQKLIYLEDGSTESYDYLISTMPLDRLCAAITGLGTEDLAAKASQFYHSSSHIIGLGFAGQPPPHLKDKCWMYFPEDTCPFYRATMFSKYSPYNVPKPGEQWSLMLEVTETGATPSQADALIDEVIEGAVRVKLLTSEDCTKIISRYHKRLEYGYPVPFLGRDELCGPIFEVLESKSIFSRGRFGSWKYEISNQDHVMMQGVEVVDRIVFGAEEVTFYHPDVVNSVRHQEVPRVPEVPHVPPTYHDCEQILRDVLVEKSKIKSSLEIENPMQFRSCFQLL